MRHFTRKFLTCGIMLGATAGLRAQEVKELAVFKGHPGVVTQLVFSPNGKILAAGTEKDRERLTKLWGVGGAREQATLNGNSPTFSPDGKWLATKVDDQSISLWELATGKEVRRLTDGVDYAFAPSGGVLAVMGTDKKVKLWDTTNWKEVRSLDYPRITFSPDGKTVAAHTNGGDIAILEAATVKLVATLKGHTDSPMVEFSPDGKLMVSSEFGSSEVILWDVAKGDKLAAVSVVPRYTVSSLKFTPDGTVLAAATMHTDFNVIGARCHVRLWDTTTRKELATLGGHASGVLASAFSPDSKLLATAAADDSIRLWNVKTGNQVAALKGHKVRRIGIHSLAFSPDGSLLASGSDDETVRLWDVKGLAKPKQDR